MRDVLLVQRERTLLALVEDNPDFPRMYREERAELAGYENQGLSALHSQVGMASELLATVFDGLSVQQLARPCLYNFPARSQRDVTWLGRHTVHELVHHLADIRSVSERVRA